MGRLDTASDRFQQALAALEKTATPLAKARDSAADAATRLAELGQERERLLARIAELEDEARALTGLTDEVEDRLDGAIAEIRTALGR